MFDTKELRIGNWINYKGDPIPVTMVGPYGVQSKTDYFLINASSATPDLKPIPITPELLKSCGFKRNDHRWKIEESFFLEIQEHGQWINNEPVVQIKYMVYKSHIGAIKEVKYLHDLQNLFFAVTNSELPVNLLSSMSKN